MQRSNFSEPLRLREWLVGRAYVSQKSLATLFEPRADHLSHPDQEEATELLAA